MLACACGDSRVACPESTSSAVAWVSSPPRLVTWCLVGSCLLGASSARGSGVSLILVICAGTTFKSVSISKSKHRLIVLEKTLVQCV